MSHAQAHTVSAATSHATTSVRDLDDLLDLDVPALERLYREARAPRIGDLSGDLRGRMLALVGAPAVLSRFARAWAGSDVFPWRGKSFRPEDERGGQGINRVFADRFKLFPFHTFIGRSRAGDFDALQLDYDRRENPFFIRAIKDEVREIAPRLLLGQAWALVGGKARLALYFGLTAR
jgi:hypothetical protein